MIEARGHRATLLPVHRPTEYRKEVNAVFQHGACCSECHRTLRIVVYVIASMAHGLALASLGALPY